MVSFATSTAAPVSTLPAATAASSRWLWWLSRLAFLLFLMAVAALLWLSDRNEADEQRATLISDMLWLEQDLRFHLTRNEELLGLITPQHAASAGSFEPHARALLANNSGLVQVFWLDPGGGVRQSLPAQTDRYVVGDGIDAAPANNAFRLAATLGKPFYSPPYPVVNDDRQFEVHVPVFRDGRLAGVVVGAYSLRRMLEQSVPWWLTERYRIRVIDNSGVTLAARTKVETSAARRLDYQLPFDPPGHGLILHAAPYRAQAPLAPRLLTASLILLAALVLWSLWSLRRHSTHRLAAEQALLREHAFRQAMEDSLQTGLRARDLEGRITYVNPAFCRMVGWPADELIGRAPPMPYWDDELLEETRALHDRILAGKGPPEGFEIRLKRRSGEVFDALIHEAPLIDARGRHTGWMSSIVDITENKRAEERERQQQQRLQATARLVTMGEMASSLAHELNQPLAAIASYTTGCINLIDSGQRDATQLKAALAKCAEQAQRAGRIIHRIYEFARRAEPRAEPCDLVAIVDEVLGLIDADARRQQIRIVRELPAELPLQRGDHVLLTQALLNLVRNGMDAMADMPADRRILTIHGQRADATLRLSIADRGDGIAEEIQGRLFEPFHTTKVEGMGIGLNICRSVVEAHRGRLWHEARPDGGCIFYVELPLADT
jgi:two-component system, LuxR family, sensor histidine kinase DctS